MQSMGRMKRSGSRFSATLYYHSFRYSLNNAEEMEKEGDVRWRKLQSGNALIKARSSSKNKNNTKLVLSQNFNYIPCQNGNRKTC